MITRALDHSSHFAIIALIHNILLFLFQKQALGMLSPLLCWLGYDATKQKRMLHIIWIGQIAKVANCKHYAEQHAVIFGSNTEDRLRQRFQIFLPTTTSR
jgi:hypothetical protein